MQNKRIPSSVKRAPRVLAPKPTIGVLPAIISDQTAFPTIGLTGGQLREMVRRYSIPHRMVGQRMLVAIDDVLAFVRGAATLPADTPEPAGAVDDQPENVDEVLALLGKRRTA